MTGASPARAIDVHAHVAPRPLLDAIRGSGVHGVRSSDDGSRIRIGDRIGAAFDPLLSDLEARLRFLDDQGIERQVISPWIELIAYDLDGEDAIAFSDLVNREIAEEVARAPDRLIGLGTTPLQLGGDEAGDVLSRAMTEYGLAGVEIGTHIPGSSLADPSLTSFFTAAEQREAILLLHPHYADQLRPMPPALEFVIANPADTALAVTALMFAGRLDEHRRLRMILSHGGGFLPYQLGRLENAWRRMRPDQDAPRAVLQRLYADTVVQDPAALAFLASVVGPERVLLGTDYPFPLGDLTPLRTLEESGLDARAAQRIAFETAAGLLSGR